jgi:hypothetical protein
LIESVTWIVVTGFWVNKVLQIGQAAVSPAESALPALRDRLVLNVCLLALFVPAMTMATGVSQALSLALGVVEFIGVLWGRTGPGEVLPSVNGSIQSIYVVHFLSSLHIAAAWMVVASIHAGLVMWWQKRRVSQPPVAVSV